MADLNQQLSDLAHEAQQQFGTPAGQARLMQLWQSVYTSGRLYRPPRDKLPGMYEDIYDEAVLQLMEYVLRQIQAYDPQKASVIGWMNMLLERRFLREAVQRFSQHEARFQRPTLADLEDESREDAIAAIPTPQPAPTPADLIQQCLQADDGDRFKQACMRSRPDINFQQIALLHHVEGYTFTEIADQLKIPYTSLVCFYHRRLEEFTPIIRAYCLQ